MYRMGSVTLSLSVENLYESFDKCGTSSSLVNSTIVVTCLPPSYTLTHGTTSGLLTPDTFRRSTPSNTSSFASSFTDASTSLCTKAMSTDSGSEESQ